MLEQEVKVQSIYKAVRILEIMAASKTPMALGEIAQQSGFPKSTLHGLISSLRELGLVEQSPLDGKYGLGLHLFELGCAVTATWDVTTVGKPYLQSIAQRIGQTAFIAVCDREDTLVLDQIEASNPLRVAVSSGTRMPLHCSSQGKLFLAYHEEPLLRHLIKKPLDAYTPHSLVTEEALRAECAAIREQGYAIENGEYRVGLRAVSAPIFSAAGEMCYAIGVVGMFRRVQSDEFAEAVQLVTEAARNISRALGYRA